ncbi:hypothetical protein OUZ56_011700 [Daphnia magna]|uniref:Integrase catalytic domain-containing protein n=1 Tax=Daphnia magna TaxID=35525 RepID=A0ABQ9Z118_9CRUS|nr:hypothetical protein OUZ56_011700 [Daphnia magna]
MVAIDALSKYVELKAVPETTAERVIRSLDNNIVHRFGTLARIVSGQGTAYMAKEMADTTLTLVLAAYLNTEHNEWDKILKEAAYAINTANNARP